MTDTSNNLKYYKNPEIENDINDALQRNIDAGLGKKGLSDVLGEQVANAKENGGIEELKSEIEKTREKYAGRNLSKEIYDLGIDDNLPNEKIREIISQYLDCRPDQISFTDEEALSGGDIVYHYGELDLDIESDEGLILPLSIEGYLNLGNIKSIENLILPQSISQFLNLRRLKSAKNLFLPQSINGCVFLQDLESIENLDLSKTYVIDSIYSEDAIYLSDDILDNHKGELEAKFPHLVGRFLRLQT